MKPIEITPRMEHVRTLPYSLLFDELYTGHRVPLSTADGAFLLDAFLSLNTGPSQFVQGGQTNFRYPTDVQLRLSFVQGNSSKDIEITPRVLEHSRSALDALDQSKLAKSYEQGMQQTLSTLGRFWSQSQIDLGKQKLSDRLSDTPISKQLTHLGTKSSDSLGGALSVSNYLFTYIPIPPISLGKVLQESGIFIQEITQPILSVVHTVPDAQTVIAGRVDILIEGVYHNELIDEFDRLEHKITPILLEVHQQLASDGPIVQQIGLANNSITDLVRQLKDLDAALADQKIQIQSLDRDNTTLTSTLGARLEKIEKFLAKQFPQGIA